MNKGFTMIEVSVTILVALILVAGLGTGVYSTISDARHRAVVNQLDGLKRAIAGELRSIPTGERSGARHGYIGDMGSLPATLGLLETAGSQPDFAIDSLLQLGAGWRGPYVSGIVGNGMVDPWGTNLVYSTVPGTSATTGAPTVASIRSPGPDLQSGTADDYVVEIYKSEALAKVLGFVKDAFGATLAGMEVTISYPSGGVITTATTTTSNDGLYTFDGVPHGPRVVQLSPQIVYMRGTGLSTGGGHNNVEFFVANLARLSTSTTSVKLSWTTDPASDFKRLLIGGVQVYNATAASGTTISFPSKTLAGTGVIQEPFRVDVSSLTMHVPDTIVGTVGTGGSLKFEVEDFEEAGGTDDVDVTGVTFTAEFSDGSKTLFSPLRK